MTFLHEFLPIFHKGCGGGGVKLIVLVALPYINIHTCCLINTHVGNILKAKRGLVRTAALTTKNLNLERAHVKFILPHSVISLSTNANVGRCI